MARWILGLIVFIGSLALVGCDLSGARLTAEEKANQVGEGIVNYGDGMYYFNHSNDFGDVFAQFKREHPELEFVGMSAYDKCGSYGGATCGYYVYFREIDPPSNYSFNSP